MKEPNFFIVGAPKCGTTALAYYLQQHPQVFISAIKEPNYFVKELFTSGCLDRLPGCSKNFHDYLMLFEKADEQHKAVGEASTRYLSWENALKEISDLFPLAKIIVALRNPADLVLSLHAERVFEGQEPEIDFEKAWNLQEKRKEGKYLPSGLFIKDSLFYSDIAMLGKQAQNVLKYFPRNQVKFILYDDLKNNPMSVYEDILIFLGIESDGRTSFPIINRRKAFRWRWVAPIFANMPPKMRNLSCRIVNSRLGRAVQLRSAIIAFFVIDNPAVNSASDLLRKMLCQHFEKDVELLERMVGRDLSSWRRI